MPRKTAWRSVPCSAGRAVTVAGYEAYKAYQNTAGAAASEGTCIRQGINLRIGIGASSASSSATTHDEAVHGSRINSQGNITIAATGGDLNLIASQVNGQNVALAAANNFNVLSQQENHTLESRNKNASEGVGIQVGSNGFGFYAEGSVGKGSAHGNGATPAISSVNALSRLSRFLASAVALATSLFSHRCT